MMSHNQGARPKDQPGADKTLKPATRQQANASNKQNQNLNQSAKTPDQINPGSSSGASGASASLPTKFDSSKAKPAVTPNKPDESTSNKRALSSPFDDSELNPMKKKFQKIHMTQATSWKRRFQSMRPWTNQPMTPARRLFI